MKIHISKVLNIQVISVIALVILPILFPNLSDALAQNEVSDASASISSNSLTRVMCNTLRIVTGSAGKTFAAFAIISVGIGFFTGKVSWGLMIGVAVGIATMFGAPTIVAAISGQSTNMMCGLN